MAATKTRTRQSSNGSATSSAVARTRVAGDSVAAAARRAKGPALAAGAGVAGGLALGARLTPKRRGLGALLAPRRKVLGVPLGRRNGAARTARALGQVARELRSATSQAVATTDDVREIREQLDKANRQSPLEVVLDGLTHRRGAHRRES